MELPLRDWLMLCFGTWGRSRWRLHKFGVYHSPQMLKLF